MLKANIKKRLTKLYSDIIQYACDKAAYVDCDTDCDESYFKDIDRFEKRFDKLIEALDDDELRCSNCDYAISARYVDSNKNGNKVVKAPACLHKGNEYIKLVYENKTDNDQSPKSIFTVTYLKTGDKPRVTVFDNREAAEACFKYFNGIYTNCYLNETYLYSAFNNMTI